MKEKIRMYRVKAGFTTQRQLADKLVVSPGTVAAWETGARHPSMKYMRKMAELFHVSLSELTGDAPATRPAEADAPPAAGTEIIQTDDGQRLAILRDQSTNARACGAFICETNEMDPVIQAGDIVIYDPAKDFENGHAVAFSAHGRKAVACIFFGRRTGIMLITKNSQLPIFATDLINRQELHILGKVIEVRRPLDDPLFTVSWDTTKTKDESAPI